jgi:hypothetical protein
MHEYVAHYHGERNRQGKSNVLLFRRITESRDVANGSAGSWAIAIRTPLIVKPPFGG